LAICPKVTDYISDFVRGKPGVNGDSQFMEPELGLAVACANVHMRGFPAFVRIEEGSVGPI